MICKFLDYQQENDAQCIDLDTEKIGRVSQLCHVNCENEIGLESCAFSNQPVLYNTDLGTCIINECLKDIISDSDNENLQVINASFEQDNTSNFYKILYLIHVFQIICMSVYLYTPP